MFYHLQMMTGYKLKISGFSYLLGNSLFFMPLFLRKTYKHFFGIEGTISNYLKRSISQIGSDALVYCRIETSEPSLVCGSELAMMVQTSN